MKYSYYIFFLILISCGKKDKTVVKSKVSSVETVLLQEQSFNFDQELKPDVSMKIKEWDEYFTLSEYVRENFSRVSSTFALEMSNELVDLSKSLRDSLHIKELTNRSMFARLNVFYSEVLRLQDMSEISALNSEEVFEQIEKIGMVYNSINMKINAIYLQKSFDSNVNFDESIFDFNEDAVVPYKLSKKSR